MDHPVCVKDYVSKKLCLNVLFNNRGVRLFIKSILFIFIGEQNGRYNISINLPFYGRLLWNSVGLSQTFVNARGMKFNLSLIHVVGFVKPFHRMRMVSAIFSRSFYTLAKIAKRVEYVMELRFIGCTCFNIYRVVFHTSEEHTLAFCRWRL